MFGTPIEARPEMDLDPVQQSLSLEEELAAVVGQVLQERASARQAVGGMEAICRRRAEALR